MQTVEFSVTWNDKGNNKIAAIKQLRSCTKCGLKEAKDAVEDCGYDQYRVWRMTAEQFGLFVVEHWSEDSNAVNFYLRDAILVPPKDVHQDWSVF